MIIENLNLCLETNYVVRQGKHHSSTSNNNNTVVFGESIPNFSRKCKYDFNRNIISRRARFKHFPGATSKNLLYYVDTTLQNATYDAAIHVGVNGILNNQSHNQTAQLMCNLRKISAKCKSYGVKKIENKRKLKKKKKTKKKKRKFVGRH